MSVYHTCFEFIVCLFLLCMTRHKGTFHARGPLAFGHRPQTKADPSGIGCLLSGGIV